MWPTNGPVEDDEDYRDRARIARIGQVAARGVVLCGVSRSGKTSLLRRLEESLPCFKGLISLEHGSAAVLSKLARDPSRGVLIDEGQFLLQWPRASRQKLILALEGRPFVIAAWPSLFEPGAEPELLRWLDGIRLECLRPFSRDETVAMIRRTRSREPIECPDEVVDAVLEATGGLPILIARLCNALLSDGGVSPLRAPDPKQLDDYVDAVRSWNDPFEAIVASLPRAHQDVVRNLAGGPHAGRALLVEHGLARDNPPRFSGTLFAAVWGGPAPTLRQVPSPSERPGPPPSRRPRPHAFRWIHLSDIHFGAGDAHHALARQAITRAIRDDVRRGAKLYGPPDRIFVTGDIAQRAHPSEYTLATAWLSEIAEAAGTSMSAVRVVPGNHDVDRGTAGARPIQRTHEAIRARPEELDHDLTDRAGRAVLAEKLEAYRRFVAEGLPEHPAACATGVDWVERLEALPGRRSAIRILGLATVWVSDAFDGRDKQNPEAKALVRNLVIGRAQLEQTFGDASPEELLLVLSHHPPAWLAPASESWLASALAQHAHVHLFGHVHDAQANLIRRFGRPLASVRYTAGATHGDPQESYGYAWGGVRWNGAAQGWEVGWAPRLYVPEHHRVVADRNRYPELDADDFDWQRLDVGWEPIEQSSR